MRSRLLTAPTQLIDDTARRVMSRCDRLASISASSDGISRFHLSAEHARVNEIVSAWMADVGMTARVDAAGNLVGRLEADDPDAPALLLGSHLDTVTNAGRYDGVLGVLIAIEVVRLLSRRRPDGRAVSSLPFALEVAAFADEEGTRFGAALLGSSAFAGRWKEEWWALTDGRGITLREAFTSFGLDPSQISSAARRSDELVGYLEAHIEQGPELDDADESLGVVTSIASARRFEVTMYGESRHAGGTRYEQRHDALLGASEIALAVERICRAEHHVVGTVGQLATVGGSVNVVPGETQFSIDLRGEFDDHRDAVWTSIEAEVTAISQRRGLRWRVRDVHSAPAVFCSPDLSQALAGGVLATRPSSSPPAELFSRAGHDSMSIAALTGVGMLFVRNARGISHHPDESVDEADVSRGISALAEAVLLIAGDRS